MPTPALLQTPSRCFRHNIVYTILIAFLLILTSCADTKQLVYFPGQNDTVLTSIPQPPEPIVQENDILSITVSSLNPEASAVFNAPNLQMASGSGSQLGTQTGYLVSTEGFIDFPIIGRVKASGLTKPQLAQQLTKSLTAQQQLKGVIVTVRQLNYHITLVGEVNRPGVYNIPSEKINIVEALGQAGDLTLYANRKNVVLIREENGKRILRRIDLNSSAMLSSDYYYLKSNDIVYAEPNKNRAIAASNQNTLISYGIAALGVLVSVATLIISVTR